MKYLLFVNCCLVCFVFITITSCSHKTYKHASVGVPFMDSIQSGFFKTDSVQYYKTSIDTYGKALSGILAIKKLNVDTLKVSFFTEFGVSFFDVLIMHDSYQLVRCIPQLDSKGVMNTIVEDIRWTVLFNLNQISQSVWIKKEGLNPTIRSNYQDVYIFSQLSPDNRPLQITYVYGSKFKSKFEVKYGLFENSIPTKIFVSHFNIDLKIDLTAITFSN